MSALKNAQQHQQQRAYGEYQRTHVETAAPAQLVVLLYEGCVRFTQRGRLALESQDYDAARENLFRAQDIVAELMSGLNLEAGEIATNLLRLYEYMYERLVTANVKREAAAALEVENLVRSLVPAWEEVSRRHPGRPDGRETGDGRGVQVSLRG